MVRENHLFVVCYVKQTDTAYVSDGENIILSEEGEQGEDDDDCEAEDELELDDPTLEYQRLNRRDRRDLLRLLANVGTIKPIKFDGQKNIDHSGSSAIAIAIRFVQYHHSGVWPEAVLPRKFIIARARQAHHKEPSAKLKSGQIPIQQQAKLNCPKRDKRFYKQSGFVMHVRHSKQ